MAPPSTTWTMLIYTLPREPSAPRVAVWRKLKKLGALLLHDAVWVLPALPPLLEHFRWLAAEIQEAGGDAFVWVAEQGLPGQDGTLVGLFRAQAEEGYQAIATLLSQPEVDRDALARRYAQARAIDYFHVPSADEVRERLEALGELGNARRATLPLAEEI